MNNPDGLPVTPEEDEEWSRMEVNKPLVQTVSSIRSNAVIAAHEFTDTYKNELHIMTLRKAYEMGYVCGALDNANGDTHAK